MLPLHTRKWNVHINYQWRLSRLLSAPLGNVGELLLYTHYDWGTSYILGYNQRRKNTKLLIIRAETLCQMGE